MGNSLENKKVALVIAFRDFRDVEYFITKDTLSRTEARVITASKEKGTAIGSDGGEATVDLTLDELDVSHYEAVVFIGGSGAAQYIDNEICHRIAQETVKQDRVLGAICCAPAILARAGVLKEKKATVWSSALDRGLIKILEEEGAIYQNEEAVKDGKIITGNGPMASKKFAESLVETLTSTPNLGVGVDRNTKIE